ncbi:MAG TPA: type I-E CRISPR-associated protein Cas5/CasD [Ottowia sp.]|uniref:type I-E CRISPR-associated protein Cas5/CasD n=1 Tax=Ottowia sp. TaxID=1898956 RepID=UPI002B8CF264|nr:type I-E CRISPR-associated protein Cas5/CasD [Ottowia sp.]HMN22336.1 type I-E CRISPR-associated protein Cas5/CasD [Ottowia sp.]
MPRFLVIRLASPLIAFGGETIDNLGVIRDFPALSMLTGLVANALGWDRSEAGRHNRLQQRLQMGCVLAPGGQRVQDYQTAKLYEDDAGWTTWGEREGREKSPSYTADANGRKALTLQRYRDYHGDLCAWVALTLQSAEEAPTLDDVAAALDRPARPLFIGRKPCLPVGRLVAGWQTAVDVRSALQTIVTEQRPGQDATGWRAQWPDGQGVQPGDRLLDICDERNWDSGVHGGWRPVRQGLLCPVESET